MTIRFNPTCPQCQHPILTRDAMLVMSQVAIWLQCDNGHDTIEIVPVSRFNPGLTVDGYMQLVDEANELLRFYLEYPSSVNLQQFNRVNQIGYDYYEAWDRYLPKGTLK